MTTEELESLYFYGVINKKTNWQTMILGSYFGISLAWNFWQMLTGLSGTFIILILVKDRHPVYRKKN